MNIAARTATAEQRSAIYEALMHRNRLVRVLRIGLPAIGAIILTGLLLQFYLGSLVPDFGFARVTLDRGNLVVEAPAYSGVGEDGTIYSLEAESARAAVDNSDLIDLTGAAVSMAQPDGTRFAADAANARFTVSSRVVEIEGETAVSGSNGLGGTVKKTRVDIPSETMVSSGGADLTFPNGAKLKSETMSYSAKAGLWQFDRVVLDFPSTPGEESYAGSATTEVNAR